MSRRRGYPIIGGPLNGMLATEGDFRADEIAQCDIGRWKAGDTISVGGKFGRESRDYLAFNRADAYRSAPTRIWLHKSLLPA